MSNKTLPQEVINNCLKLDDYLQVIKKALSADSQDIEGFVDHYSELLDKAIALNWENHNLADELKLQGMSLDRIREILN